MKINVCAASEKELDAIAALEAATFSAPWKREDFAKMRTDQSRLLLAAHADGAFCGYIGSYTVAGESDITTVAVLPDFRRCGVGLALLQALCNALSGQSDAVFLEVRESNTAARRLYEKCGFCAVGKRNGYYTCPTEDAILYKKEISENTNA